jgi:hypothetical protein
LCCVNLLVGQRLEIAVCKGVRGGHTASGFSTYRSSTARSAWSARSHHRPVDRPWALRVVEVGDAHLLQVHRGRGALRVSTTVWR